MPGHRVGNVLSSTRNYVHATLSQQGLSKYRARWHRYHWNRISLSMLFRDAAISGKPTNNDTLAGIPRFINALISEKKKGEGERKRKREKNRRREEVSNGVEWCTCNSIRRDSVILLLWAQGYLILEERMRGDFSKLNVNSISIYHYIRVKFYNRIDHFLSEHMYLFFFILFII